MFRSRFSGNKQRPTFYAGAGFKSNNRRTTFCDGAGFRIVIRERLSTFQPVEGLRATSPIHGGSSVESGFQPGTLRPKAEALPLGHLCSYIPPGGVLNMKIKSRHISKCVHASLKCAAMVMWVQLPHF
ncbi:hypothetical protein AVEN_201170-1 [Araneus ventricosus]|uniref:Uncharacterized protein n=1 Tax=Araneus ventricosus TaxID=182803 RepID=A0A4Y2KFA2_ARAVE|nr:hypothetical protein AVEN_201170-1 [Araneus ventricosus]